MEGGRGGPPTAPQIRHEKLEEAVTLLSQRMIFTFFGIPPHGL